MIIIADTIALGSFLSSFPCPFLFLLVPNTPRRHTHTQCTNEMRERVSAQLSIPGGNIACVCVWLLRERSREREREGVGGCPIDVRVGVARWVHAM